MAGECKLKFCVLQVYERAVGNVPPALEKRFWQRYIYLWMNYALWEELGAEDPQRTRAVYQAVLGLIPHQLFTFAKVCSLQTFQPATRDWQVASQLGSRQPLLSIEGP